MNIREHKGYGHGAVISIVLRDYTRESLDAEARQRDSIQAKPFPDHKGPHNQECCGEGKK